MPSSAPLRAPNPKAPGSYGVRFVKPFFQHLVVCPCWKEGSEGWSCWSSSRRARSQTWFRSDPRLVPFMFGRTLKPEPGAAHCHLGAVRKRRWSLSSSSQLFWRFVRHCGRSRRGGSLQRAASRAPMGTSPVSARRHSAITSLRMSATIRTFFMRPLAPPRRALNRCASALSG